MTWRNPNRLAVKRLFQDFFPYQLKSALNSKILLSHYKRKVYLTQYGISASLLLVSPSIWCDALHDRVWHLPRLVPWKVGVLAGFTILLRQGYWCMRLELVQSVHRHHLCNVPEYFLCSCVGVEEDKAAEIDLYHCPNCQVTHGPSVSKSCRNPHYFIHVFSFSLNKVFDPSSVSFIIHSAKTPWRQQTDDRLQLCWNKRSKSPGQDGKSTVCTGATESDVPQVSKVQCRLKSVFNIWNDL